MALLEQDGVIHQQLDAVADFDAEGTPLEVDTELALVVGSAEKSEQWVSGKQWQLQWRDADIMLQAPRPLTTYGNTYVLEPDAPRFTVGKVLNSIVPQLMKGLFYEDPPFILRPGADTTEDTVLAKKAVFKTVLRACNFQREVEWGVEQFTLLGTGIWKWGTRKEKIKVPKRKASVVSVPAGQGPDVEVTKDEEPQITWDEKIVCRPYLEFRDLRNVLVAQNLKEPDISLADWVIDQRYVDFYQTLDLFDDPDYVWLEDGVPLKGDKLKEAIKEVWQGPSESTPAPLAAERTTSSPLVHHGEDDNIEISPDPLRKKLEILEYCSRERIIVVLNRKKRIKSVENKFKKITFLSANWWNRPKAFYGMGIGLIVGPNQRIDQGAVNAMLKILSYGVNPTYLKSRDANTQSQMIYTNIGKVLTVDGKANEAYSLLENPKVDPNIWAALRESQTSTESSTGADQMLVQGSTEGGRTSMGRTSGGANILAGASASRLEGPLGHFINQVFIPWLYILDELVFLYMSDAEIKEICSKELGKAYQLDLQAFHDAKSAYDVLAGAYLAAKKTMMQSLTLITQFLSTAGFQQQLAEVTGEYINLRALFKLWLEASEWGEGVWNDLVKKLTPEMKAAQQQKGPAAQIQGQMELNNQKFEQKQQLEDQSSDNRIKRDVVRIAEKATAGHLAVEGEAGSQGFGDE